MLSALANGSRSAAAEGWDREQPGGTTKVCLIAPDGKGVFPNWVTGTLRAKAKACIEVKPSLI